jgi:hypothetical protein
MAASHRPGNVSPVVTAAYDDTNVCQLCGAANESTSGVVLQLTLNIVEMHCETDVD